MRNGPWLIWKPLSAAFCRAPPSSVLPEHTVTHTHMNISERKHTSFMPSYNNSGTSFPPFLLSFLRDSFFSLIKIMTCISQETQKNERPGPHWWIYPPRIVLDLEPLLIPCWGRWSCAEQWNQSLLSLFSLKKPFWGFLQLIHAQTCYRTLDLHREVQKVVIIILV